MEENRRLRMRAQDDLPRFVHELEPRARTELLRIRRQMWRQRNGAVTDVEEKSIDRKSLADFPRLREHQILVAAGWIEVIPGDGGSRISGLGRWIEVDRHRLVVRIARW